MNDSQTMDVRPKWLGRFVQANGIKYLAFALMFAGVGSAIVYARAATAAQPLTNQLSGLCLSGGEDAQVRPCDGGKTQNWSRSQDGTIEQDGKCISIDHISGSTVMLDPCDGSKYQRWHLNEKQNLVNVSNTACLQPLNGAGTTAPLETTACTQAAAQRWN